MVSFTGDLQQPALQSALDGVFRPYVVMLSNCFFAPDLTAAAVTVVATGFDDATAVADGVMLSLTRLLSELRARNASLATVSPFNITSAGISIVNSSASISASIDQILQSMMQLPLLIPGSSVQSFQPAFGMAVFSINCSAVDGVTWPQDTGAMQRTSHFCFPNNTCEFIANTSSTGAVDLSATSFYVSNHALGCAANQTARPLAVAYYRSNNLFPTSTDNQTVTSNSILDVKIGTASFGAALPSPFIFRSTIRDKGAHALHCGFYNSSSLSWPLQGCIMLNYTASDVYCQCNHLTSFAVLLDTGTEMPAAVSASARALVYISYIGLAVSMFCLLLTIFTLLRFGVGLMRSVRPPP